MVIDNPDLYLGNIITTRIRLARNVSGYPFHIEDYNLAREIVKKVNRALVRTDTFNLFYVSNLSDIKLESMKEKHLISQNLIENREFGAVLINTDQSISVMINEEDHIREQCFVRGLRLKEAYDTICKVDNDIAKNLEIAFDEKYGYLTACPTNLGTGMRASVLMFLPALTESGKIGALISEANKLGLTVRGLYGEGSEAEGFMYQISNEVTLGVSEEEILSQVEQTVLQICKAERDEMQKLYVRNELSVMDKAHKSFGVLTNSIVLSYSEFLAHISRVKLGAMLGMIEIPNITEIDDLIVKVRPASLCEAHGKKLSQQNRDLFRAEIVGRALIKMKG